MNQNHFAKGLLFQQNIDAQGLSCYVIDAKCDKDDCCLGELGCFNNFPSFHNLSFDELVAHKFVLNEAQVSNLSLFDSIKYEESLQNQNNKDILVKKDSADGNCESNLKPHNFEKCSSIHKESEDKTTHI